MQGHNRIELFGRSHAALRAKTLPILLTILLLLAALLPSLIYADVFDYRGYWVLWVSVFKIGGIICSFPPRCRSFCTEIYNGKYCFKLLLVSLFDGKPIAPIEQSCYVVLNVDIVILLNNI
jgi:hypothetical protein